MKPTFSGFTLSVSHIRHNEKKANGAFAAYVCLFPSINSSITDIFNKCKYLLLLAMSIILHSRL